MGRKTILAVAAAALGVVMGGCVERQLTLVTDPPGAKAYYNNACVGTTPTTFNYTFYAAPDLRFEKDGYETMRVVQPLRTPVYQKFPLDFFSEVLYPGTIRDRQSFTYKLAPRVKPDLDLLMDRAKELRDETLSVQPEK